jgi:dynein intermediate chain 1, axonemal
MYKAYPAAHIEKKIIDDDEDEEGKKKGGLGRKKKEVVEEEKKEEEDEPKVGQVGIKSLFSFENADLIQGRQITAIDVSDANEELIAVSYGEFDISCTDESTLKPGLLCFWTLKNTKYPELTIESKYSITCCAFAKRHKNWIAVGDSHGNIAIYNIQECIEKKHTTPFAHSQDLDMKHTDIVWEI